MALAIYSEEEAIARTDHPKEKEYTQMVMMYTAFVTTLAALVAWMLYTGNVLPPVHLLAVGLGGAALYWLFWSWTQFVPVYWLSEYLGRRDNRPLGVLKRGILLVLQILLAFNSIIEFFLPNPLGKRRMLRGPVWGFVQDAAGLVSLFGISLFYFGSPVLRPWFPAMDMQALVLLQVALAFPLCLLVLGLLGWQGHRITRQPIDSTRPRFVGDVPRYPGLPHMPPAIGPRFSSEARKQQQSEIIEDDK